MNLKKNSVLVLALVILVLAKSSKGHSQSIRATIMHHNARSSPVHNPNASEDEIRAQDFEIARHRAKYFHNKKSTQADTTLGVGPGKSALFIKFRIGTQRIPVHGFLDTGSSLTWVQCAPCTSCFKQKGEMYNRKKSSSFKLLSPNDSMCNPGKLGSNTAGRSANADACNYTLSYVDSTFFSGVIGRETFTFKHRKQVQDFIFGCSTYNIDEDYNPPGLIGLGSDDSSIIKQLHYPHFYYYVSYSEKISDMVGILDIGTPPAVEPKNPIPLIPYKSSFYYLGFKSIYVSGKNLQIPNSDFVNDTIIDSGSAYTSLKPKPYETLTNAIIDAMGDPTMFSADEGGLCYQNVANAPRVDFLFQNYKLRICPTNLWFKIDSGLYCLAIFNSTESIIGMYQQRGMKVAYDLDKGHVSMSYINNQCPPFG